RLRRALASVELVERRQLVEVALDARREVRCVAVVLVPALAAHELPLRLPPGPLTLAVRLEPEAFPQPRPLGANDNADRAPEQHDRQPGHGEHSSPSTIGRR